MYQKILVTLDATPADRAIVEHVKELARLMHSEVALLHVADGWAARMFGPDAVSPEVAEDLAHLEKVRTEFQATGIQATAALAFGEPGDEIVKWVHKNGCDLIGMASHGHKLVGDIFLGSTIDKVRHNTAVPILVVRAGAAPAAGGAGTAGQG